MEKGLAKTVTQPGPHIGRPGCCDHTHSKPQPPPASQVRARLEWALEKSRAHGLRLTGSRQAILQCLASQPRPATLSQIQDAAELRARFDAATIYRTIMLLRDLHIVRQIPIDHKLRYFVLNSPDESCAYLVCQCCGNVTSLARRDIDQARSEEITAHGYVRLEHLLEVHGLCPACQVKPGVTQVSSKLPVKALRQDQV